MKQQSFDENRVMTFAVTKLKGNEKYGLEIVKKS